jgi:hypothetical protein
MPPWRNDKTLEPAQEIFVPCDRFDERAKALHIRINTQFQGLT